MFEITNNSCAACGACVNICPKECISISKNEYGFYMPVVDKDLCISCGRCQKICPANNRQSGINWQNSTFYAMWAKDAQQRFEGSSGGVFGLLSDLILEKGGIVFGAAYSDDKKYVYQTSTDKVTLNDLKKSKYVESYTGNVFSQVKNALENGRSVLYCGTSCQIDGLKNFLNKEYPELLTCDFLCHGVPAAGIYEKYINNLESKYGKVTDVNFRSKAFGWKAYCSKVTFESGKTYLKTRLHDPYLRIFFENNALRDSCYECQRLDNSNADITLGDFWKVAQTNIPDDNKGVSLIGVHTEKGSAFIDELNRKNLCFVEKLSKEKCSYAYNRVSKKPQNRDKKLSGLLNSKSLFNRKLSLKEEIRATLYLLRAILQGIKLKLKR